MNSFIIQTVFPFILAAAVVVIITVIAERYGTKIGGILGTLPSTMVVAFVFIYLNKGAAFASDAAVVIPAEIGINMLFLLTFALLVKRSVAGAFAASFLVWAALTSILYFSDLQAIAIAVVIYALSVGFSLFVMERVVRVRSSDRVRIQYTPGKLILRGILAGVFIAAAVLLSNVSSTLSGIVTVFPVIIASAMFITVREHGPKFAAGMAKSMSFGTPSVVCYAVSIHFLYPVWGLLWGSLAAYGLSAVVTAILFSLRSRLS